MRVLRKPRSIWALVVPSLLWQMEAPRFLDGRKGATARGPRSQGSGPGPRPSSARCATKDSEEGGLPSCCSEDPSESSSRCDPALRDALQRLDAVRRQQPRPDDFGLERFLEDGVPSRPRRIQPFGAGWKWVEMGSEKETLGMSELGCADGCGRRGRKGGGGNRSGEGAAGDERAWMRRRLRTAWVQGSAWKWVGRRSCWRRARLDARTVADGVGARESVEMGREKKPLGLSELGCADGCGRQSGNG
eukprot:s4326_g2.t1